MAPEQIQGGEVDGRTYEYSLACVLYQCLTGEVPFDKGTDVATLFGHLQVSAALVSARRADLPVALDEVIARGMAKDQADRHPTCTAMINASARAVGLSLPSGETASPDPTVVAAAPQPPLPPLLPMPPPGESRRRAVVHPAEGDRADGDDGARRRSDRTGRIGSGFQRRTVIAIAAALGVVAIAAVILLSLGGGSETDPNGGDGGRVQVSNTAAIRSRSRVRAIRTPRRSRSRDSPARSPT